MARMPAKQVPLSTHPEALRFVEVDAAEHTIKIKYPVSSGQMMVQGEDAEALQRLAREKQRLTLKLILMTSDNTTKCPCGSGKKLRKCHRTAIEQMLKFQ
ncbi:MAG: SEC-C domain-containing protein [Thiobacillus sp.]|nr:SEC-C domain-containing protein [Thiobacillus sp.]